MWLLVAPSPCPCLRLLEKIKSVMANLQSKSEEIEKIYSDGVINGFTKMFLTYYLIKIAHENQDLLFCF
jgi:hypothetical protein